MNTTPCANSLFEQPWWLDTVAGRNALEMILAIYQSAATGNLVKLPLRYVASKDFTGRFSSK